MAEKTISGFFFKNWLIVIATLFYFAARLTNLTLLPIFNDEAIYLDWGYKTLHTPNSLFFPLFDAKQPLLMWVFGISEMIFYDPLFAGRVISVMTGFLTLLGIYFIGKAFFNKKIAAIAGFFYMVIPLFSFFDRQALAESAVACIGIWSCYTFLQLQKKYKTKQSVFLGTLFGFGFFTKSNVLFFVLTALFLYLYIIISQKVKKRKVLQSIFWFIIVAVLINVPLFTQQLFWDTLETNQRYSLTIQELLTFPLARWFENFQRVLSIGFWHITPIIFIFSCIGIFFAVKNKDKNIKRSAYWSLCGITLLIIFSRNLSPRYVVSFLPLLCIFASYAFFVLWKKQRIATASIVVSGSLLALWFNILLIFSPTVYFSKLSGVTAFSQKGEYVVDWPSGYGVNEAVKYLTGISKEKTIYVGVRPDAGNPESAMFAYFNNSRKASPTYINANIIKPWSGVNCIRINRPFYYVSRDNQIAGLEPFIEKEVFRVYKPENKSYIAIYKLRTTC